MNNPTSEQVEKVAAILQKMVFKYPDGRLGMMETRVNIYHSCGTIHCHGGWYALGRLGEESFSTYSDGANALAEDLGFKSDLGLSPLDHLEYWAEDNPKIWGNKYGYGLFSSSQAFTPKEKKHAENLQDIVDHWLEVAARIKKIENK